MHQTRLSHAELGHARELLAILQREADERPSQIVTAALQDAHRHLHLHERSTR